MTKMKNCPFPFRKWLGIFGVLFSLHLPASVAVADESGVLPTLLYACDLFSSDLLRLEKKDVFQRMEASPDGFVVLTGGGFMVANVLAAQSLGKALEMLKAGGVSIANLSIDDMLFLNRFSELATGTFQPVMVSATFQSEGQNWKTIHQFEIQGKKVAFSGVCALPVDSPLISELAEKGIRYRDPAQAIREALKEVPQGCPLVILGNGDPVELVALEGSFPTVSVFIVSGTGIGGQSYPIGTRTFLAPSGGKGFAVYDPQIATEKAILSHSRGFSTCSHEWSEFEKSEGLEFKPVDLAALAFPEVASSGTGTPAVVVSGSGEEDSAAAEGISPPASAQ